MKFLNAISTAVLAGLSLLLPAAYGEENYECKSDQTFCYSCISSLGLSDFNSYIEKGEPLFVGGEIYGSHQFTINSLDGTSLKYLIQSIGVDPSYQLFEASGSLWKICTFKNT
ncbi:BgTH12-07831 [Blumeria graminis f. sp. triticale]|uniref:Bgt-55097 n=2 Tax=Blumeria graminis TaxID=34373 RepID=A0A9X9QH12_BLUGR|nr:BgTH12-07831 [Blumeria graminis f. sp. triticale]VDB96463.1 Bgt-55097 [Blumeria graminis f. sp. tritici]